MSDKDLELTNKLLKVVISLMVRKENGEARSLKEQIEILSDLGLQPKEISEILGRSNTYVNKELVGIRRSKKKRS